jgi:VPDSG-CTERM exosortase interaction domain
MKALPQLLFALAAVAAFAIAQPANANLITNPGFEQGFTGWQTVSGSFIVGGTINGVASHSGIRHMALAGASTLSQSVAVTSGTTYTIDFFAATSNVTSPFTLTVNFGGTVFSHLFTANTGYSEFTFNATPLGSSTNLSFVTTGAGFFALHLDDISVVPAGVPDGGSTVSLLGCALLGLAALRRKLSC